MKTNIIPIFYACDDNFAKYMTVSLCSMMKHSSPENFYRVYVLHTGIGEQMQKTVISMAEDNFEISFNNVSSYMESVAERLPVRDYYTKTTYFRLFIADMFPEYDKAIYIDADTVVMADIARLYSTDIGENLVGACHEQAMVQNEVFGSYCEKVVGVDRGAFFNAGLLLINCRLFRERDILTRFTIALGEYTFVVTQDEDYLNLLCKDRVFWLDSRWNTELTASVKYPYAADDAYIVHYIMANKPWHYEDAVRGDIFWKYAALSPLYRVLCLELEGFTDEGREKDRISCEKLLQLAKKEIDRPDNYQKRLNKTRRSADRVAIINKIEQYEAEGKFDLDVEEDPPTKPLMPEDVDYLRQSIRAKINTLIAYLKAKKFLKMIQKKGIMQISEIKGIENLQSLDCGAVVTCNHFNPFDSFAIHEAYLRSGQKRKLYRVIREGNYTSFTGFYGYLMRHFYTLPLSSNPKTMRKFTEATDRLLAEGNLVMVYPEQSMWWNYRKPKPLKPGAYRFAVKNNVPILPCFITMKDTDRIGDDGFPIQEYTIHIDKPIYPNGKLYYKDSINDLMGKNHRVWQDIYEKAYGMKPEYSCEEKLKSKTQVM